MQNQVLLKMIEYFGKDVRRINHALKVHSFAMLIANQETTDPKIRDIVGYASALHDIGIKEAERKYNSSAGNYQEIEGPPIASQILSDLNIAPGLIERIRFIIGNHHTYNAIDGLDFQILVEADFLVNIYEDQISTEASEAVCRKIFKTSAGRKLMEIMYLNNQPN